MINAEGARRVPFSIWDNAICGGKEYIRIKILRF